MRVIKEADVPRGGGDLPETGATVAAAAINDGGVTNGRVMVDVLGGEEDS